MSSDALDLRVDLERVVDPHHLGDVGLPDSAVLLAFTNAVASGTPDLAETRRALTDRVGEEGLLEAAATIAIFGGLVRVADGTGIQLDDGVFGASADDRRRLGIDDFAGSANTVPHEPRRPASDAISELFG